MAKSTPRDLKQLGAKSALPAEQAAGDIPAL